METEGLPLQVWRKMDYPQLETGVIWDEILALRLSRKRQVRKAARIKRYLDALVLDLWVAATCEDIPWRSVSRNKSDYQKETRYRKLFFKFDLFVPLLDDLIELGYVVQKKGKFLGLKTRIRASDKLLACCTSWNVSNVCLAEDVPMPDVIVLKNSSKEFIDYTDTNITNMFRREVDGLNDILANAALSVEGIKADTSARRMHRVFNNSSFMLGGRYYGGFWQGLKQRELQQRQQIRIDGEEVTELYFKCMHPTFLYNMRGLQPPFDSYAIEGIDRADVKSAFMVILNCKDRKHALSTMRHEKHIKNSAKVLAAIEKFHAPIVDDFYSSEMGMSLMHLDSLLAGSILADLTSRNIVVLPIHDSFIVKKTDKEVLHRAMVRWYEYHFNSTPIIDYKY